MRLDVDTRPDVGGVQYTMTAVKDVPSSVAVVLGATGTTLAPELASGACNQAGF